jgi:MFS family permease
MTSAAARLPAPRSPRAVVLALCTAQAVGWAWSFYLPTLLAEPMARNLGTTPPTVFAVLSAALLIGALVSPWPGRRIDTGGGRTMLLRAWALFVAGLATLAATPGPARAGGAAVRLPGLRQHQRGHAPAGAADGPGRAAGRRGGAGGAGRAGALPFMLLHGLGNGLLTIVRGTLPLALFGSIGYGARQGVIALPGRLVGAASPFLLGWVLEHHGRAALGLTATLGVVALFILAVLRVDNQARR